MLRLLPVKDPGLVELLQKYPGDRVAVDIGHSEDTNTSARTTTFSGIFVTAIDNRVRLQSEEYVDAIGMGEFVTPNYFEVLGVEPALGRLINDKKDGVAVLSWACWQNRFHGDPDAIGKKVIVQDQPATIIGVTPRAFTGLRVEAQTDVWQSKLFRKIF